MSSSYLQSSSGVLKILHIIFGALSIGLIVDSFVRDFVPVHEEIVFVSVVATAFVLSSVYLLIYCLKHEALKNSKINLRIDFAYHIALGVCLVFVGVDVNSLEGYFEYCTDNCPSLYTKGVAKILTFINGVLYGILAFLNAKDDDLMKEEELSESDLLEDFPLIYVRSSIGKRPRSSNSIHSTEFQYQSESYKTIKT